MPHGFPPHVAEAMIVHPVGTTADHHAAYSTGEAVVPATFNDASPIHTPSGERSRSKTRDPFWKRTSRSQSRDPDYQKSEQLRASLSQAHAAQASTDAANIDRATRHSLRDEHSGSQSRSVSHIRNMVKSIAHDPFFHRASAHQTDEDRAAELHKIILDEVAKAKEAAAAGEEDRAKRHQHGADRSGSASRSQSRVRDSIKNLLHPGSQPKTPEEK